MSDVQITNFTIVKPRPNAFESESLAFFDAEIRGIIRLKGCKIVRKPDGSQMALPPSAKSRRNKLELTAWFLDQALHREFADRAFAAYRALAGNDGLEGRPDNAGVLATVGKAPKRERWAAYR